MIMTDQVSSGVDMGEVIKSPNDLKEYRAIRLSNGLRALLISDPGPPRDSSKEAERKDKEEVGEEETREKEQEQEKQVEKVPVEKEQEQEQQEEQQKQQKEEQKEQEQQEQRQTPGEKKHQNAGEEKEEKEKEEVDDEDEDEENNADQQSAAALYIHVGSFCDPPDVPGLAHFLEHMVFLGDKKRGGGDDADDFDSFVKTVGGSSDANTASEYTSYEFSIVQRSFREALGRFAQCIINPRLKKTSCDRELQAVDSEFDMALTNDGHRREHLWATMARPGHPMGKFTHGNKATLKTIPEQNGIDVLSRLQEFHKRYYSAQYMCLTVQSQALDRVCLEVVKGSFKLLAYFSDDLDTLEAWVTEIFSHIPNNQEELPSFEDQGLPFDEGKFHKFYKAVPVENIHYVVLTWQLPSQRKHYREKPLHYLKYLISHDGEGGINAYLKRKLLTSWAVATFEHNSSATVFQIFCSLTRKGLEDIHVVITTVFQYLDLLRREGPQERIFKEIQTIEANNFLWPEEFTPYSYTPTICENMLHYPTKHYLTGDDLLYDYNEQLIDSMLAELVPSKANLLLYSSRFTDDCTMREPWFNTPYTFSAISPEWESTWENLEPNPHLHLPEENVFIATDFSIQEPDVELTEYPVRLTDSEQSELWYKKDDKYNIPRGYISFILRSPFVAGSPLSSATFDIFVDVLRKNLSEVTDAASTARLSFYFAAVAQGLSIYMDGYNHKLPRLFESIVDHIADFSVDEELLEMMIEEFRRTYYNRAIDPSDLCCEVHSSVLWQPSWNIVDRQQCLKHITIETLLAFVKNFKSQLYIQGFVHGNFTAQEARHMETYLLEKIGCEVLPSISHPLIRVAKLPVGERYIRVQNFNQSDNNSAILNYYQYGPATKAKQRLSNLILFKMMGACVDILRIRDHLGYTVFSKDYSMDGILGLNITVCSQADKFSMKEVDDHIEKFLEEFRDIVLNMSEKEFKELCEHPGVGGGDESLQSVNSFFWDKIYTQTYEFDEAINQPDDPTFAEFCAYLQSVLPPGGQYRKLSTQVVGNPDARKHEAKMEDAEDDPGSKQRTSQDDSGDADDKMESKDGKDDEEEGEEGDADDKMESKDGKGDEEEEEEGGEGDADDKMESKDGKGEEEGEEGDEDDEMKIEDAMWKKTTELIFVPTEEAIRDKTITDIRQFCNSLPLYPDSKKFK